MEPVRLACVRYLNTVPLIEGLEKLPSVTLLPTVPSRIAGMVASGEADLGLVSLIDAVRSPVPLALVPCGMIGCDGPTLTVRLFSTVPLDQARRLHADSDSHTSVALARVLLSRLHGANPPVVEFDARAVGSKDSWPETFLLIGDKVVTGAPSPDRCPYQLDLGEAWKGLTGLPFVYAVWMCRADRAGVPAIASASAILDRQRRHNRTRLDWIVSRHAQRHGWPEDLARRYLGSLLRFEVGEPEREAAGRFIEEALGLGLVERTELRWSDGVQVSK